MAPALANHHSDTLPTSQSTWVVHGFFDDGGRRRGAGHLGAVGRLLGGARRRLQVVDVADGVLFGGLLQPVLVVERLQREPTMRRLAAAASLRDVWIVATHRTRLVHLQLRVQPLQLRLTYSNYTLNNNNSNTCMIRAQQQRHMGGASGVAGGSCPPVPYA